MTADYRSAVASLAMLAASFGVSTLAVPGRAGAQTAGAAEPEDLARSAAGSALAGAMTTLARQPRDIDALLTAGEAALTLDDPRSALGFFGRADDLSPNNGRVKAGLGRAMMHLEQIGDGLRLMEQAGTLGYSDKGLFADRGLARDLMGNQAGAQQDYQAALRLDPKNETVMRRYAVSLGISGQVESAQKMLQPMLYKSDRAAWRDNAFILAMNGRTPEALSITDRVMPRALADAIKPYMERMAMLTPEQRAAAVHMGQFPPGLVNVRVASTAVPVRSATATPAPTSTLASAAATPVRTARASRRKGATSREPAAVALTAADRTAAPGPATVSAPAPTPIPAPVVRAVSQPETSLAARSETARPVEPAASGPVASEPAAEAAKRGTSRRASRAAASRAAAALPAASRPAPVEAARPTPSLGEPVRLARVPEAAANPAAHAPAGAPTPAPVASAVSASAPAASVSTPVATPVPAPVSVAAASPPAVAESPRTLADIMAEIRIPEAEKQREVAPVNLAEIAALQEQRRKVREAAEARARRIADAKEAAQRKAEAEAKAKADAETKRLADNPARYWVQIGAGNREAMAFTLKRMKAKHDALGSHSGWTADWGRTSRLVVGPFPSLAKAKAVEAEMKKGGSDAFVWRSAAGEEVSRVGGK